MHRYSTKHNMGFQPNSMDAFREFPLLRNLIATLHLSATPDVTAWRWSSRGDFTVRGAYRFLIFDGINDTKILKHWRIRAPAKIKIFLWLGARDRIPTADLLRKRGWIGPSQCPFCFNNSEWAEHLFLDCTFARELWAWLLHGEEQLLQTFLNAPGSVAARWSRARGSLAGTRKPLFDLGIAAGCWELWMERNRRIFHEGRMSPSAVCGRRIVETVILWQRAWDTEGRGAR